MLILKLTSPESVVKYIAAAFPSACGKTNLAMITPTIPGWTAEILGDYIAWMRIGEDGRLYAVSKPSTRSSACSGSHRVPVGTRTRTP